MLLVYLSVTVLHQKLGEEGGNNRNLMSSSSMNPDSIDFSDWIKKDRLEKKIEDSKRQPQDQLIMEDLLFGRSEAPRPTGAPLADPFESILNSMVSDQLKRPEDLLKLNPSRREGLGRFLNQISKNPDPVDAKEALKQFVSAERTQTQHLALKQLFRQIALVQIAKALLLRSWSLHAGTSMDRNDLKDLTAAVERNLRPFINLQTSTCQLIQQNFYSWYKLTPEAQSNLWMLLDSITDLEAAKAWLLRRARALSAETLGERGRYGEGFYRNLWRSIEKHQLLSSRSGQVIGFSPTLRDGCLFEHSPKFIHWIGFEPISFELLFCEVRYLWKEPKSPPLWAKGTGLEMSMDQQASLPLTHCGKQNILRQMDAISCAEIAVIAEENLIRTQGGGLAAQALRKGVDQHVILRKIKQPATTRGIYQACQTLDKLRQDGILLWAREEVLSEECGKPALHFLLNQAKILMIADLSALTGETPALQQDIPKVIYLLKKENRLEERKNHRPILIKAFGSLSSERDLETLFDRLGQLLTRPDQVYPPEPFQLQTRVSPMEQREWEQHWFNPNDDDLVDQIEDLKRNSNPLGQFATIRTLNPALQPVFDKREPHLFPEAILRPDHGFFLWVEHSRNGNEIYTAPGEKLPAYLRNNHNLFYIAPLKPEWNQPLQTLVRSGLARDWFDYSVERKKGAWLIKESDLKQVPVPKHIGEVLQSITSGDLAFSAQETRILSLVSTEPHAALRAVENHPRLKGHAFVHASQTLAQLEEHQGALFSLISPDEQIRYPEFFQSVLTEQDLAPIHQHPLIRFNPTLPPHQAIQAVTPMKSPSPGLLLGTSKGLTQMLYIQDPWLLERAVEAIDSLKRDVPEPSWAELTRSILLPKSPEHARAMASRILKAFSTEKLRRKELNHLISVCLAPRKENSEKIGLLQ